MNKYLLFH